MQANERLYINEREAAQRYGLSVQWFQRERWQGSGPEYIKVKGVGKILYPIASTDAWFESFKQINTSQNE